MQGRTWNVPCIFLKNGQAAINFFGTRSDEDPVRLAEKARDAGAYAVMVFDLSADDWEQELNLDVLRKICREACIPVYGTGNISRMEDVKKLLYAGCTKTFLNFRKPGAADLLPEVSSRFGRGRTGVFLPDVGTASAMQKEVLRILSVLR